MKRPWRAKVRAAIAAQAAGDPQFHVCAAPTTPLDVGKPLLIIVHPGDAIEDGQGYPRAQRQQVIEFGKLNTDGMAGEISAMLETADIVILHRESSLFDILAGAVSPYIAACRSASERGTVLCGDDLDAASDWILENMGVAERPSVFMTGAYACANYGCITAVGQRLQSAQCPPLSVSQFAPTDNCNGSPRWIPESISLAQQWAAILPAGPSVGAIKALDATEVIQHVGQGRHVVWQRAALHGTPPELGSTVTIARDGFVSLNRTHGIAR